VAPEAVICSIAKQVDVAQFAVLEYIHRLRLTRPSVRTEIPANILAFFHPETLAQILGIRESLLADLRNSNEARRNNAVFCLAALLGILHGHATYSLSIPSAHAYSMSPNYVMQYALKHALNAPERDVKACLVAKISRSLAFPIPPASEFRLVRADARTVESTFPELHDSVDLVITSPPYLNAQTYAKDNWLRHWLLGADMKTLSREYIQTGSVEKYTTFMRHLCRSLAKLVRSGGKVICIAGEVRLRNHKGTINTIDVTDILIDCLNQSGSFVVLGAEEQVILSSKRYYHALVNSGGHSRVPLTEKTIIASRR
jgi:hypothetical protein